MIKNDEGIAYGLIAVIVFIVGVAALYICFTPMMNSMIETVNGMIEDGQIGVQTVGSMNWSLALFSAIPVIGLLGILIWSYVRAIEEAGV